MRRSNCSTLIPSGAYQFCKAKTNSTRESWFSELPEILIVHLKRYRKEENTTRKDFRQVKHGDNITIDVIEDSEILVPNQVTFTQSSY